MALGGSNITWAEGTPADGDLVGLGAGAIRSILTNTRGGLDSEHVWPSAGGLAGQHRPGSAVAFYGTNSQVSSTDTDGRLMVTSDKTELWAVHSALTYRLGGRYVAWGTPSFGGSGGTVTPTVGQRWTMEVGVGTMPPSGATNYTTINTFSGAGAIPVVFSDLNPTSTTSYANHALANVVGTNTVQFVNYLVASGASGAPSGGTYTFNFVIWGITA